MQVDSDVTHITVGHHEESRRYQNLNSAADHNDPYSMAHKIHNAYQIIEVHV